VLHPFPARTTAALAALLTVLLTAPAAAQTEPTPSPSPTATPSPEPTPEPTPQQLPLRQQVRDAAVTAAPLQLSGSGFGHGVGMSQYGAYALGLDGRSAADILRYYYRGVDVLDQPSTTAVPIRVGIFQRVTTSTAIATVGDVAVWQTCPTTNGTTTCRALEVDGAQVVQPAGQTWRVGYLVEQESGPNTFGIRRQDGTTIDTGAGARLRLLSPSPDGHLFGPMPNASSAVDLLHGFHEFVDNGPDFHVVHQEPSIESYLKGLAEVPSSWGIEAPTALQAQAIAGRTYAVRLRQGGIKSSCGCHILATPANQNWTAGQKERGLFGERWVAAVQATAGDVVAYQGDLISTFYSSSHGGRSENIEDSWAYGTVPFPYLRSVEDPWSLRETVSGVPVGNNRRAWTVPVTNAAFSALVGLARTDRVEVLDRTVGGTPRTVRITGMRAGDPTTIEWTRPSEGRKRIAGANMRIDLLDASGTKLPSSQLDRFTFAPFSDDDGTLFEAAIAFVARAGIAQGVDETSYAPELPVTRGEMAAFLDRTLRLPEGSDGFDDVPADGQFSAAVRRVAAAGITRGYGDGTFRPSEPIQRAEFAAFLRRAFALADGAPSGFDDVPADGIHSAAIDAVRAAGITLGCGPDRFCPTDPVTREQMAAFLQRAVDHVR